jgi:hypothetical protein
LIRESFRHGRKPLRQPIGGNPDLVNERKAYRGQAGINLRHGAWGVGGYFLSRPAWSYRRGCQRAPPEAERDLFDLVGASRRAWSSFIGLLPASAR